MNKHCKEFLRAMDDGVFEISYNEKEQRYFMLMGGIGIRDNETRTFYEIKYCPFCGTKITVSQPFYSTKE
jgi:hypothetical protein